MIPDSPMIFNPTLLETAILLILVLQSTSGQNTASASSAGGKNCTNEDTAHGSYGRVSRVTVRYARWAFTGLLTVHDKMYCPGQKRRTLPGDRRLWIRQAMPVSTDAVRTMASQMQRSMLW